MTESRHGEVTEEELETAALEGVRKAVLMSSLPSGLSGVECFSAQWVWVCGHK